MLPFTIRQARPDEAERLTEIACRAKSHWGYSREQIEAWRPAFLTITTAYIKRHSTWVAANESNSIVAFAALELRHGGAVLEHLWVLPEHMGRGIGSRLFRHLVPQAGEFTFTSDPHADGFYLKLGARLIGEVESDLQGRRLSLFRYDARSSNLAE